MSGRLPTAAAALLLLAAAATPGAAQGRPDPIRERVQEGLRLLQAGERERAEEIFAEIVAAEPRHGTARFQLGRLAHERGDLEEAREHLEIATASDPQRLFLAWNLLGRVQLQQRDPAAAQRSFTASLEAAPRFAPSLVGRARAELLLGRTDAALADLEQALELPATPPDAPLLAAELLVYLERAAEARRLLEPLARDDAEEGATLSAAARLLLLALGDAPEDDGRLAVLAGRNLSLAPAYLALGIRQLARGDLERAARALRIALELDDADPMAALFLARAAPGGEIPWPEPLPLLASRLEAAYRFAAEGHLDQAAAVAGRLLEQRPHLVPARLLVAREAESRKDYWTALAAYRQVLAWLPGLPALESRLADLAHAMGAEELAECSVRRALEHFPTEGALHYRLATILEALGDGGGALAALERAVELGFHEVEAFLTLGKLHLARMDIPPAIAAYRRALEVDPDAAEAIGTFALSSLTTEDQGALEELLERHAAAHPENFDTLYGLGSMRQRAGDLERAAEWFRRAAAASPDHAQVHYNLGQIALRRGLREEGEAEMARFGELKAEEEAEWERHNRGHFLRLEAEEALAGGDPAGAMEAYRGILAEGTAGLADYRGLASALLAAGRAAEAFEWIDRALALAPYDPEALELLASAAEATGRETLAREARERLALLTAPCWG